MKDVSNAYISDLWVFKSDMYASIISSLNILPSLNNFAVSFVIW